MSSDEEELLVLAEFDDTAANSLDGLTAPFFKAIGLDTDAPLVQLDNYVYKGKYSTCLGTDLLFEVDATLPNDEVDEHTAANCKFVYKTRRILNLERVLLKPKHDNKNDAEEHVNRIDVELETQITEQNVHEEAEHEAQKTEMNEQNEVSGTEVNLHTRASTVEDALDNLESYVSQFHIIDFDKSNSHGSVPSSSNDHKKLSRKRPYSPSHYN